MEMLRATILILCSIQQLYAQIEVSGQLQLDSSWARVVCASRIPSLGDMYRCSEAMIIASDTLDASGRFTVQLPTEIRGEFIRLHVFKKEGPVAMLIIGGKNENHGFFALSEREDYHIWPTGKEGNFFRNFSINEPTNNQLRYIDQVIVQMDSASSTNTMEDRQLLGQAIADHLIALSDTCSRVLPAIYSAYMANMGFNQQQVQDQMRELLSKFDKHPYLTPFVVQSSGSWVIKSLSVVLLLIATTLLAPQLSHRRNRRKIARLSQQERKVAGLVASGKTNKEIAQLLHVEISTIKSHVYQIFNKLQIKSRKEVSRFSDLL